MRGLGSIELENPDGNEREWKKDDDRPPCWRWRKSGAFEVAVAGAWSSMVAGAPNFARRVKIKALNLGFLTFLKIRQAYSI